MLFAVSLSILSHSLRTSRHLPDEKEQLQGTTAHCSPCCRGCFTHTGNPSKSSLGPAVEGKATLWRGDSVFAKEHSAFVPEQTRAYKTHFGFSDCQLKICRFSRCPQIPLLKPKPSTGLLPGSGSVVDQGLHRDIHQENPCHVPKASIWSNEEQVIGFSYSKTTEVQVLQMPPRPRSTAANALPTVLQPTLY